MTNFDRLFFNERLPSDSEDDVINQTITESGYKARKTKKARTTNERSKKAQPTQPTMPPTDNFEITLSD